MKESDVGTERDIAGAWVIEIDSMTVSQARDLGRVLAEHGLHGHFLSGDVAYNLKAYAEWRANKKGGEADGGETIHQA